MRWIRLLRRLRRVAQEDLSGSVSPLVYTDRTGFRREMEPITNHRFTCDHTRICEKISRSCPVHHIPGSPVVTLLKGAFFQHAPTRAERQAATRSRWINFSRKHYGHETRFPSLILNAGSSTSPSYTENGAMIPAENDPRKIFDLLFRNESKAERNQKAESIRRGRSVMDVVGAEAKTLQRELGKSDREKLDALVHERK